jgi:membrane protein DedA with SNARE-associated domain
MLTDLFLHFGYVMVFVASAIEGDATLLTATYLAHRGYLRLDLVIVAATLGTILVNQIYFRAARHFGQRRVADLIHRPLYGRVFGWIERYGLPLILTSRFIYGCRIAIPVACGASGMAPARFTIADIAGAVFWSAILGAAGYALGQALEYLVDDVRRYEWCIAAVVVAIVLIVAARRWRAWRAVAPHENSAE